jgi:hypothetical protein
LTVIAVATTSTRMSAGIQVRTANYCRRAPGSAGSLKELAGHPEPHSACYLRDHLDRVLQQLDGRFKPVQL